MNFLEASKMKEGTLFNVIVKTHRGGWLNCYFENGMVKKKIGSKLAATVDVFNADWEVVEEDKDWNLADSELGTTIDISRWDDIKKCRDLIIEDLKYLKQHHIIILDIINKRFGNL